MDKSIRILYLPNKDHIEAVIKIEEPIKNIPMIIVIGCNHPSKLDFRETLIIEDSKPSLQLREDSSFKIEAPRLVEPYFIENYKEKKTYLKNHLYKKK